MQPILSLATWVSLPPEVRNRIRIIFSIPRSSHTMVEDGRVVTDGTTTKDFGSLTVDKMQKYTSSPLTDFHKLFDLVLAKVNEEMVLKVNNDIVISAPISNEQILDALRASISVSSIVPTALAVPPKKRGRPAKK